MADTEGPAPASVQYRPPGGCPCGVSGCLMLMVVVSAVLLVIVVLMALLRPEMTPMLPRR